MDGAGKFIVIFTGLLTLATVAVILSQNAQTSSIIQALGQAASTSIGAATAPVTGQNSQGQTSAG